MHVATLLIWLMVQVAQFGLDAGRWVCSSRLFRGSGHGVLGRAREHGGGHVGRARGRGRRTARLGAVQLAGPQSPEGEPSRKTAARAGAWRRAVVGVSRRHVITHSRINLISNFVCPRALAWSCTFCRGWFLQGRRSCLAALSQCP